MPIDTLYFLNHRCVNVQLLTLKDTILPRRIKYSFVQLYNVAFELPRIINHVIVTNYDDHQRYKTS